VAHTTDSLLALEYPRHKLSVILVDNGSTDNTREVMEQYRTHPQVSVLSVLERGKHHAVNAGIGATSAEIIGCLDADSFVECDALHELLSAFHNQKVAAVTAAMSVHKPRTSWQHMQYAEYLFGIASRHTLASINGLYVTPGPFSLYRREIVQGLGGFRFGYQTEDMEMALRLQRHGYWIDNAPRARVYTKAPHTLSKLLKQRTRWISGFLRNILFEYRDLLFSRERGALGFIVLPLALLSIASGVLLFWYWIIATGIDLANAITIRSEVPFTYAYLPQNLSLDWFYLPITIPTVLMATLIPTTIIFMSLGKRISQTPGTLWRGALTYLALYGLVAPWWLMRASRDVALNKKRGWR
jgi:cellulose synthase/poly-beta-1,6-N-acetylglucosamine synthase-like glycosyltransferase